MNSAVSTRTLVAFAKGGRAYLFIAHSAVEFFHGERISKMVTELVNRARIDNLWDRFPFEIGLNVNFSATLFHLFSFLLSNTGAGVGLVELLRDLWWDADFLRELWVVSSRSHCASLLCRF